MAKTKLGLILGGGGARGLAHIGLIKVLEKNNVKIPCITGTSMGALIGGMYAQNPDAIWVEQRVREFLSSEKFKKAGRNYFRQQTSYEPEDLLQSLGREIKKRIIINLAAHRKSLMKGERLTLAVNDLIRDGNIEDTKIPFACSATDLKLGEAVIFNKGNIRKAITASASIPGFIPPLDNEGRLLVDGSICDNFPVDAARQMGADLIVASNVSLNIDNLTGLDNLIDIIIRSNSISTHFINQLLLEKVDFVFSPDTGDTHWSEFDKFEKLFKKGEQAAEEGISDLLKFIKRKNSGWFRIKLSILEFVKTILSI
jgi:NTE family protein